MSEEVKILDAFKYWYETNTEKGVTSIPDYICKDLLDLYKKEKEKNFIVESLLQGNLYQMYLYYRELASKYQGNCVKKEDLKQILYPTPENPIDLEIQNSKMYKKLLKLIGE